MSKKILCCFVLIVLMLTSCSTFSEKGMLAATGSYAVPGMSVGNIKGTEVVCNILDEDQYGRIIFEFECNNVITQKREKAIVIVQKYTEKTVWFYEDVCYLIEAYQQFNVGTLKEQNDWDKPLNEAKMTSRVYNVTFDLFVQRGSNVKPYDLRAKVADKLSIAEEYLDSCLLDATKNGADLYWFSANVDGESRMYYVISDGGDNVKLHLISDTDSFIDELWMFKAEVGWN